MSYVIYSTRGFVLGSVSSGEASRIYSIYTEDFGLIKARAQSVRLLTSKLRYNLDDYSLSSFSLVKGKEIWRLTGVERLERQSKRSKKLFLMNIRVLNLVKRLVHGEEKNSKLFQVLLCLFENKISEPVILARILDALGYLDFKILQDISDRELIQVVNKALKETHL